MITTVSARCADRRNPVDRKRTTVHAQGQKSFVRDDLASESVRLQQSLKSDPAAYARGKVGRSAPPTRGNPGSPRDFRGRPSISSRQPLRWSLRILPTGRPLQAAALAINPGNRLGGTIQAPGSVRRWRHIPLTSAHRTQRRSVSAFAARKDLCGPAILAAVPRRLCGESQASRRCRRTHDLRGIAGRARLSHHRLKVNSNSASPRVCFQFSDPLPAEKSISRRSSLFPDRLRQPHSRRFSALCRWAEAQRALRHGASPRLAVGCWAKPFSLRRLRDLCSRPRSPSPLYRAQLCAAEHGSGGHSGRIREHREGGCRGVPDWRPQPSAHIAVIRFPWTDYTLFGRGDCPRQRREDLEWRARYEIRHQPRRGDGFSGHRGGWQARARNLRDDGQGERWISGRQ